MLPLVGSFVIAGGAAGFAVHQPVFADADVVGCLAEAAELIALATTFGHFTLGAQEFCRTGSGGHTNKVAGSCRPGKRTVGNLREIDDC